MDRDEQIAKRFHEVYEELAPGHGWETQQVSRVEWADVPDNNKKLMIAVVRRLLEETTIL